MISWVRKIGLTQIDGPERGFATIIKANPKLDLRNAARSKVANVSSIDVPVVSAVVGSVVVTAIYGGTRAAIAIVSTSVVGVASAVVIAVSVGSVIDVSRYETTLVVKNGIIGKIGSDAKDTVESVSLNSGLNGGGGGSSSYSIGASATSGSVGFTSVHELVAHGLGYNPDVLSRTVGVGFYAKFKADSAPHETYTEIR